MIRATVQEVQSSLPRYLAEVARGEIVEVTENEQTVAELRAAPQSRQTARPIGLAKGTFEVPPSFFEPLPAEILDAFNGDAE
jgi:antitoxin (DNA-binding transcriptional repressor) of toxin-antitoxin stability system